MPLSQQPWAVQWSTESGNAQSITELHVVHSAQANTPTGLKNHHKLTTKEKLNQTLTFHHIRTQQEDRSTSDLLSNQQRKTEMKGGFRLNSP